MPHDTNYAVQWAQKRVAGSSQQTTGLQYRIEKESRGEASITDHNSSVQDSEHVDLKRVWDIVSSQLSTKDEDLAFWWTTTGFSLYILMEEAGYDRISQQAGLKFHFQNTVPYLGPRPTDKGQPKSWRSFMTDDFSPLEYSWSWDNPPRIRYSFEPISTSAGTTADPFNRAAALEFVHKMSSAIPGSDWQWFHAFAKLFYEDKATVDVGGKKCDKRQSSSSSIFIALEIQAQKMAAKAYFVPVKAEQTGRTRLSILSEAVHNLERDQIKFPSFELLENFIEQREINSPLQIVGVAIDCVHPTASRLKIYLRSQKVSFDDVCSVLSVESRASPWNREALDELRKLWSLVLDLHLDSFPSEGFTPTRQQTSGVLYNFDIKAAHALPEAKVYIPVRHYGLHDHAIANGLTTFMRSHGRGQFVDSFLRAIERICRYRRLDQGRGVQTYISCSLKKGRLALTSYISPEIYHEARWTLAMSR